MSSQSHVYLVGSGPGDPGLLTVKALQLIQEADVVVYDRLVSEEIVALIPAGAARIFVGKTSGCHSVPQDEINRMLVSLAQHNRQIVRLKGGDPFIFGRGSEEAAYLVRHNVSFGVVPGITSAVACAAYAGIPLTHRGLSTSVQFLTGHRRDDGPLDQGPDRLRDPDCTLAIYMGIGNLDKIAATVISAGRSAATPAAIIESGTTCRQRRILSTLEKLADDARSAKIKPPAMVVIGKVVSLAETLEWFIEENSCEAVDTATGAE